MALGSFLGLRRRVVCLCHREISLKSHGEDRIHVQFAVLRVEAQSINSRLLRQDIILALHLQPDISLGDLQVQRLIVHGQLHQPQFMFTSWEQLSFIHIDCAVVEGMPHIRVFFCFQLNAGILKAVEIRMDEAVDFPVSAQEIL